jgi:transposase
MTQLGYADLRGHVKDPLAMRTAMVRYALEHGVKPAARTYGTSPQTVRLWLKRYRSEGLSGLKERPKTARTPHPQTTPKNVEEKIVIFRKKYPHLGQDAIAQRLRDENIRISGKTVGKLLHKHALLGTRSKTSQLTQRFNQPQPFEEVCFDLADLEQSHSYAKTVQQGLIPRYEVSLRDVATGARFVAFAKTLEPHNILCFAQKVLWHLATFSLKPSVLHVVEGSQWLEHKLDAALIDLLTEHRITPKFIYSHPSYLPATQAAFVQLIDLEFSEVDQIDVYQKALELERFFNITRREPRRKASPFEFAQRKLPELPMAVMEFQPFCLDECDCNNIRG